MKSFYRYISKCTCTLVEHMFDNMLDAIWMTKVLAINVWVNIWKPLNAIKTHRNYRSIICPLHFGCNACCAYNFLFFFHCFQNNLHLNPCLWLTCLLALEGIHDKFFITFLIKCTSNIDRGRSNPSYWVITQVSHWF